MVNKKHAYLIMVHNNWKQLCLLLSVLDDERNDIYLHIDKKSKNVPIDSLKKSVKKSKLYIYSEYEIYWGDFSQVECELYLFEKASKNEYYRYHLISGADLPIKSQDYIHDFFEKNADYEFVHYTDENKKNSYEIERRTRTYHFLQKYCKKYKIKVINKFFAFLEKIILFIQKIFHVNRLKNSKIKIKYGSQWISITNDLVQYILKNKELIQKLFKYTNCPDELFIQTIVYNSKYKNKLFYKKFDDSVYANMRLIDWNRGKNGSPYVWNLSDKKVIDESECLFARKFDINVDKEIIEYIISQIKETVSSFV